MKKATGIRNLLLLLMTAFVALTSCKSTKVAEHGSVQQYESQRPEWITVNAQDPNKVVDIKQDTSGDWSAYGLNVTNADDKTLYNACFRWIGVPYVYAGHDKTGTDCSGMVMEIYLEVYDIKLHRNSAKMHDENCVEIDKNELRAGDLVFFSSQRNRQVNHVGLYLKDNKFLHAGSSGVTVADMNSPYFVKTFVSAGRVKQFMQ